MKHVGKYIYGVIAANEAPNFGPIGMGGHADEVTTIGIEGLAAVVSNASMDRYVLSKENLTAHMKVIEKVMESYMILPMRFCTVAETANEVISFLECNSRELRNLLRDMEDKVEVDLKILWKDIKRIYEEIAQENRRIRELKQKKSGQDRQGLIHAGELVATALEEKKVVEGARYLTALKKRVKNCKLMDPGTDQMLIHAAFLLDRAWLKEFDHEVEKLSRQYKDRVEFQYVGPMAPFSFVDLQLRFEGRES